ncbi:hypothetical protein EVJ32_04695 [Exiguobacterium sp. SH5S4]|uniref:hypothetical protein n=1 Tax=Exiguobacterium sp. SH5S4 TaxID=2510961 RepID=UPI00103C70E3|nr:hypothetical protein [Exiguobacterium sp. SH5S4]TCI26676.1 hypothetical protein EVJ32_04695 [Exiguobacterium sp. SH5S4]
MNRKYSVYSNVSNAKSLNIVDSVVLQNELDKRAVSMNMLNYRYEHIYIATALNSDDSKVFAHFEYLYTVDHKTESEAAS